MKGKRIAASLSCAALAFSMMATAAPVLAADSDADTTTDTDATAASISVSRIDVGHGEATLIQDDGTVTLITGGQCSLWDLTES